MKLAYVEFKKLQKFGSNASTNAINGDGFGELQFKPAEGVVMVGKDIFPLSAVERMRGVDKEEICPECGTCCQDARGLGAHRKLKHGVDGTSK